MIRKIVPEITGTETPAPGTFSVRASVVTTRMRYRGHSHIVGHAQRWPRRRPLDKLHRLTSEELSTAEREDAVSKMDAALRGLDEQMAADIREMPGE